MRIDVVSHEPASQITYFVLLLRYSLSTLMIIYFFAEEAVFRFEGGNIFSAVFILLTNIFYALVPLQGTLFTDLEIECGRSCFHHDV